MVSKYVGGKRVIAPSVPGDASRPLPLDIIVVTYCADKQQYDGINFWVFSSITRKSRPGQQVLGGKNYTVRITEIRELIRSDAFFHICELLANYKNWFLVF